jgi:hypothetical protein
MVLRHRSLVFTRGRKVWKAAAFVAADKAALQGRYAHPVAAYARSYYIRSLAASDLLEA